MSDITDPDWGTHCDRHFTDHIAWRRECLVRLGKLEPTTDEERRQASEGPRKIIELDTFRNPVWKKQK